MFGTGSGPTWIQANLAVAAESGMPPTRCRRFVPRSAVRRWSGSDGGPRRYQRRARVSPAVCRRRDRRRHPHCCCSYSPGRWCCRSSAFALSIVVLGATFGSLVFIFQKGTCRLLGGFTAFGAHQRDRADPVVLHRLRAVDGLSDVHPGAHRRGVRRRPGSADAVAIGMAATRRVIGAAAVFDQGSSSPRWPHRQLTYLEDPRRRIGHRDRRRRVYHCSSSCCRTMRINRGRGLVPTALARPGLAAQGFTALGR